ncbi:ATP-binding cassette domain-containing protein [Muricoccus aerilatus]|uniref:ATP-binding cassette domain-containing protein n=1 Tax=Muricoccus aerilatus TaxID=452982 RepID=UPI000693B396|nr:ABC transporter ATP-binding protein [Roseomonas aerilata]
MDLRPPTGLERPFPFRDVVRQFHAVLWQGLPAAHRRRLLLVAALVALGAGVQGLAPLALTTAVDRLTTGHLEAGLLAVIAYSAMAGLSRALRQGVSLAHGEVARGLERDLYRRAYAHALALPHAVHLGRKAGELARTVTDGVRGWRRMMDAAVFTAMPFVVEISTVATVLLAAAVPATLVGVLLAFAVAYGLVFHRGLQRQRESFRTAARADAEAQGVAADALASQETVKLFAREALVEGRIGEAFARGGAAWDIYNRAATRNGLTLSVLFTLALGATLLLAAREVAAGRMTPGGFVLVNAYVLQVVGPVERLGNMAREIVQGLDLTARLRDLMAEPDETTFSPGARTLSGEGPVAVQVEGLRFGYDPRRPVLHGIDLAIPAGHKLAVVGRSGSGKSTLARLLCGLYRPDGGTIRLDGVPVADLSLSALREAVAVVPQDTILFHDTLRANLLFARPEADEAAMLEAARTAELDTVAEALPDGWDTVVGERGLRLSGGEKQRVAIARAVLKRPRLLLLDEATASLDTRTERAIQSGLEAAARGVTTLVIAHRLSTIRDADEIAVMEDGRIVERGRHAVLLAQGGYYAALWHAQEVETPSDPEEGRQAVALPVTPGKGKSGEMVAMGT